NRATAALLGEKEPLLRDAALDAGFNTNALLLTEQMVQTWAQAGTSRQLIWPTNNVSQWLLKRFVAGTENVERARPRALQPPMTNGSRITGQRGETDVAAPGDGRAPAGLAVMGLAYPATNNAGPAALDALSKRLAEKN